MRACPCVCDGMCVNMPLCCVHAVCVAYRAHPLEQALTGPGVPAPPPRSPPPDCWGRTGIHGAGGGVHLGQL